MCDPPKIGEEPPEDVRKYEREVGYIFDGLKERATLLEESFNDMQ